jgi:allantoin racemase
LKIVYVVPGVMAEEEQRRRESILRDWAFEGTQVDLVCVPEGPASIESMYEEYLSIPSTAKLMVEMEERGYDGAILGCAGDPGLDAMRELTEKMLVVGPGQTSMIAAAMLGHKFSVITPEETLIPSSYELAFKAGVLEKLTSVIAVNIPVLELMTKRDQSLEKIIQGGRTAIDRDRADALVLGCMSMGFLEVSEEIEKALGVPVINPAKVGLKMAEALVDSGLRHSKKAFGTPVKIRSGKVKSIDDLYQRG